MEPIVAWLCKDGVLIAQLTSSEVEERVSEIKAQGLEGYYLASLEGKITFINKES